MSVPPPPQCSAGKDAGFCSELPIPRLCTSCSKEVVDALYDCVNLFREVLYANSGFVVFLVIA